LVGVMDEGEEEKKVPVPVVTDEDEDEGEEGGEDGVGEYGANDADCKFDSDEEEEEDDQQEEDAIGLLDDLKALLFSERLSDVVFLVGAAEDSQETIYAHKLILAAASPIMALMVYPTASTNPATLKYDERHRLKISLPSTSPAIFKHLLEAIYTDETEFDSETIGACIRIAKKYCCEKFHLLCADFLSNCLTIENACKMYNHAVEMFGDPDFGMEFLLKHGRKCFETDGFLSMRKDRLQQLLAHDDLSMAERDIFSAVVAWGEAECKRYHLESGKQPNLRTSLEGVVQLVRFPLMRVKDFTNMVVPSGTLQEHELLDIYTYLANSKNKVGSSSMFCCTPRVYLAFDFKWGKCGAGGVLDTDKKSFSRTNSGYCCAVGDRAMEPNTGKYFWAVRINTMSFSDWQCGLGVASKDLNFNNYLSSSTAGWSYFNQGCRCHNSGSNSNKFGGRYLANHTIGVLYNSDSGTLTYFNGEKCLGEAFKDINRVTVWPAVQVNGGVSITLVDEAPIPDDAI